MRGIMILRILIEITLSWVLFWGLLMRVSGNVEELDDE